MERGVGEVFGLFLCVGDKRDVRVHHAPAYRLPVAEAIAAHRPFGVQLAGGDPGAQLRLRRALPEREADTTEAAKAGLGVTLREHLVGAVDQCPLLSVYLRRLAAQIA